MKYQEIPWCSLKIIDIISEKKWLYTGLCYSILPLFLTFDVVYPVEPPKGGIDFTSVHKVEAVSGQQRYRLYMN